MCYFRHLVDRTTIAQHLCQPFRRDPCRRLDLESNPARPTYVDYLLECQPLDESESDVLFATSKILWAMRETELVSQTPEDSEQDDIGWELEIVERCTGTFVETPSAVMAEECLIPK